MLPHLEICSKLNGSSITELTQCRIAMRALQQKMSTLAVRRADLEALGIAPGKNSELEKTAENWERISKKIESTMFRIAALQAFHLDSGVVKKIQTLGHVLQTNSETFGCSRLGNELNSLARSLPIVMSEARRAGDVVEFRRARAASENLRSLIQPIKQKCPELKIAPNIESNLAALAGSVPDEDRIFRLGCSQIHYKETLRNLAPQELKDACMRGERNPFIEGSIHLVLRGEYVQ
jgi:hypothetical protein